MMKILTISLILLSFVYSGSLSDRITNSLKNINELKSIGYSLETGEVFVVKRDGKYYKKFDTKPFTGRAVYVSRTNLVRLSLKDGIIDGYFQVFSNYGNLLQESTYVDGKLEGKMIRWSRSGEQRVTDLLYKDNMPCEGWIKTKTKELDYKDCKKSGLEYKIENGIIYKIIYKDNEVVEKYQWSNKRKSRETPTL